MAIADGIQVLENLCTPSNISQFEAAIQLMLESDQLYILGMRSSKALALYFEYVAERFYPHIRQLSLEEEFVYDRIANQYDAEGCAFSVFGLAVYEKDDSCGRVST